MNSEQKIETLLVALNALYELPVMKLAENRGLVNEINQIVNKSNVLGIIDDIKNERIWEKNQAFNNRKNAISPENPEFLGKYVNYQTAAYNHFSKSRAFPTKYTELVGHEDVRVFNSSDDRNPFDKKEIKSLKETREFKAAFNSIYSDRSLQIGTSNDPTAMSSYIDYSPYIYNYQYYISIPTLAQTIDLPINIATREMPDIWFDDSDLGDKIEQYLKRSRFTEKLKKMLRYSALSPRGALVVPIFENGKVRFNVFNDTQFTYAATQQYSRIDFQDNTTGVNQIFCLGHMLQNEVTAHFLCPGFEPIFAIGKNRIYQLKDAAEAVNIYLYTIKVLCIRAQVLVQKWSGEGQNDTKLNQLKRLTENINSSLSLSTAVKLPEDASLDILNNNLSPGFAEIAPVIKQYQGMLSGIMSDYFYGSDTAYSANSFNLQVTHQNVKSQIQIDQIEPIYRFVINTLLQHDERFKQYSDLRNEFDIEFKSLYEETEQEKAALNSTIIDNIIKMRDYPELEDIFKKEKVLKEEYSLQGMPDPEIQET